MLTLEARLDVLRRRRRASVMKRVLTLLPVVAGASIVLLVALAGMATSR